MVEKKKVTKADCNELLSKQMKTNTQINDMLNKTLSAITVSPQEQRKKTLDGLHKKYLDAKTKLHTAPVELEASKKNYYTYKNGESSYNTMKENELQQEATLIAQQITNKFNEETNNAHIMNSYYNTEIINSANTIELYNEYLKKNADLEKSIKDLHGDVLTNDRKTYYESEAIDNIKLWHKFFIYVYYILVAAFIITVIMSTGEYSRIKQLIVTILLIAYPFIINYIVKWIYSMYLSLQDNAPSNVYMKL